MSSFQLRSAPTERPSFAVQKMMPASTARSAAAHGYHVVLAADAHTTHDKAHADAAQIRAHHNATLPAIRSFGVSIRALPAGEIAFAA